MIVDLLSLFLKNSVSKAQFEGICKKKTIRCMFSFMIFFAGIFASCKTGNEARQSSLTGGIDVPDSDDYASIEEYRFSSLQAYTKQCLDDGVDFPEENLNCSDGVEVPGDKVSYLNGKVTAFNRINRYDIDQSTCVLFCRKTQHETQDSFLYDDINLICANRTTGKTCFFNSETTSGIGSRTSGENMLSPNKLDKATMSTPSNPWSFGVILRNKCISCHATEPFISTPMIKGIKRDSVAVIPDWEGKPYRIGAEKFLYEVSKGEPYLPWRWTPLKYLVSPEVQPCSQCHPIGGNLGFVDESRVISDSDNYYCRLIKLSVGAHAHFEESEHSTDYVPGSLDNPSWGFMPPRKKTDMSSYKKAFDHIMHCCDDPNASNCVYSNSPD